jgi:hypothetical protein
MNRRASEHRRVAAAAGLSCCVLLTTGCAGLQIGPPTGVPDCPSSADRVVDAIVLVAQSVPSAQLLPCLRELPLGWNFHRLDARSGRTEVLVRAADRDGEHEVTVTLAAGCEVAGARESPSEQPGARRSDRVARVNAGYLAERYYMFEGGCITYRFDLGGRADAASVAAISAGLGFVSRRTVAAAVSERSHGRLTLDPPGQDAGSQR